ncbi:hypothetical protein ACFSKL_12600 [Belliella marina]|uniref:Uncharacterized protein n=1 Tax=Belliella marina TaxID=1644146 RepID=A0ABW4VPZ9_9BACT
MKRILQSPLILVLFMLGCSGIDESSINLDKNDLILKNASVPKHLIDWYKLEIGKQKEFLKNPKNLSLNKDKIKLLFREHNIDWASVQQLDYNGFASAYEFEIIQPELVYPHDFINKYPLDFQERINQTLLIFDHGENIKGFLIKYYYEGEKQLDFSNINYNNIPKEWTGEIWVYRLDGTHVVSFNILGGRVLNTTILRKSEENIMNSSGTASAMTQCYVVWTPGPCEPIEGEVGIVCYDSFSITCTSPPVMLGYTIWSGSGGSGGGSGGIDPGDQYLCDFDPDCIPHPDVSINIEDVINFDGYYDNPIDFVIESNPGVKDWQSLNSAQRFIHLFNHIVNAKANGNQSLNIRNIFSNWPWDISSDGPIKGDWANIRYNGNPYRIYYEIPVVEPWSIISVTGYEGYNDRGECRIEYLIHGGNLRSGLILIPYADLCSYFWDQLL